MTMRISSGLLERLHGEAAAAPTLEICGLLLGNDAEILEAVAARNMSSRPEDSFEIDPQALFAVVRAERSGGPAWIGHYHSHPRGRAEPSARDREAAAGTPVKLWLILAGGSAELWRLGDDAEGRQICQRIALVA
ncbi:Mov34/MPN/PAD-1 family protein [Sphingomonas colocasiae]|uniref:M67 family metallopeptidase n=1 Tax=Sphingomonas colocasiae TaxID=1848973 RepID=A0ABS7PNJ3_9SPHN|nr:M67 family metallopeptidase [Sphingomonas colocasiae]MBY8822879.1 M67 family metallopeptidase [Sphingomonas colocasiae]